MHADTQERGEEKRGSDADQNQERDLELLTVIEKHPAVILTLLVRTRDPPSGAWIEFVISVKVN